MAANATLPAASAPLVDQRGLPTPQFYRFFMAMAQAQLGNASASEIAAINAELAALQAQVDALPANEGFPTLQVLPPITSAGLLQNGFAQLGVTVANSIIVENGALQLSGDATQPIGNTWFYGTSPSGVNGWQSIASALAESPSVTLTTGADGITTFSLPVPTGDLSGAWPASQVVSTHLAAPLPVAQGGTAQGSLTAHAVLLGEGTAGVGNAPTGTAGALLVDQGAGADPAFKAVSGDATLAAGGALALAASGVTAGTYGDSLHWPKITLDAKGRATAAQNVALPLLQGYIDGLQMQWVSGTAVTISSGTAYIPALGDYLLSHSAINLTGLSLTASTFYHIYLYSNAGTPAVECVTTAPVLYYGTAYQKSGDNTRRYVGSVLTDATGNITNFMQSGQTVIYKNTRLRVLSSGASTTSTSIDCSAVAPTTATLGTFLAQLNVSGGSSNPSAYFSPGDILASTNSTRLTAACPALSGVLNFGIVSGQCNFDSSKHLNYIIVGGSVGTGGAFLDLTGYLYER